MGSDEAIVLSELTDKLLICELCHQEFDIETHRPQLLPCYHSFCEACLEPMKKEGHFHCPLCRRVISPGGALPEDTTRIVLLNMKRSAQAQEGVSCQGCSEERSATSRCLDCAEFLCDECQAAHTRVKLSKEHRVVTLEEAATSPTMFVPPKQKCDRHTTKELELFCTTCGTSVCPTCALTRHKECRDIVELESVLEEKKKEMTSVCGKLGTLQHTFNGKVAESESSLANLDESLAETEREIRQVFADIAAANSEREEELVNELRAKAKFDKKLLQEQHTNFRCMMSAADISADYGKRLISMNLGAQMLTQKTEIQKLYNDLSKKTALPVKKAPKYKFFKDKVSSVKNMLKKFGDLGLAQDGDSSSTVAGGCANTGKNMVIYTQTPCVGLQDLRVTCPVFALDTTLVGPGCSLSPDNFSLYNEDCPSCSKSMGQPFKFKGTCGTTALPMQTCYWQSCCNVTLSARVLEGSTLCEIGVATQQALQAGVGVVTPTNQCAIAVWLYTKDGCIVAQTYYKRREIAHTKLTRYSMVKPLEQTFGFLLDHAKQRFFIIDVTSSCLLCECHVELTSPLWPFINVVQTVDVIGADVRVTVQTGPQITITPTLARLIHSTVCSEATAR